MAASPSAAPDVSAFVNSFARKPQLAAEPVTPSNLPLLPESELPLPASIAPDSAPEAGAPAPMLKVQRAEEIDKPTARKEAASPEQGAKRYAETFLKPIHIRKLKAVYMDEDTHNALAVITQASDNTPLADLVINIVKHHFETYGPDIRAFVNEQEKKNKKRLPY